MRDDEVATVFRDDRFLVIDTKRPRFPDYCCKSGVPVGSDRVPLSLDFKIFNGQLFESLQDRLNADAHPEHFPFEISPMRTSIRDGLGVMLAMEAAWAGYTSVLTFHFAVPVSEEWHSDSRLLYGGLLLGTGLLCTLIGLLPLMTSLEQRTGVSIVGVCAVTVGLVLAIAGWVLLMRSKSPILKARRFHKNFLWVEGAHPSFLERLPPWPYEGLGQRLSRRLTQRLIVAFVGGAILASSGISAIFFAQENQLVEDDHFWVVTFGRGACLLGFLLLGTATLVALFRRDRRR